MKTYNEMFLELTGPNGFFEGQEENIKDIEPAHLQSLYAQFSLTELEATRKLTKLHWDTVEETA